MRLSTAEVQPRCESDESEDSAASLPFSRGQTPSFYLCTMIRMSAARFKVSSDTIIG